MSTLDDLLGIDSDSPEQRLATQLAKNDYRLLMDLIRTRRASGLTQEDVARTMGVKQPTIAAFERMDSDPKLSTIRRYSFAIGALVSHDIDSRLDALPVTETTRTKSYSVRQMTFKLAGAVSPVRVAAPVYAMRTDFALAS